MAAGYVLTEARYDRVLAWINKVRAEHKIGKPLKRIPRGIPKDGGKCPLAVALKAESVAEGFIELEVGTWGRDYEDGVALTPPNYIDAFINAFDEGACTRLRKLAKA